MNKEYIILSDGSVAITNENGNIRKTKFDNEQIITTSLILENKIEVINENLEKLNRDLEEFKVVKFLCEKMRKFQPIVVSILMVCGFLVGGVFSTGNFVLGGVYCASIALAIGTIIGVSTSTFAIIIDKKFQKKIIGLESSIETANKLKNKYEKELSNIKQTCVTETKVNYEINNPISLEKQNKNMYEQIENELSNSYEEGINSKKKQKILTKKKKHN